MPSHWNNRLKQEQKSQSSTDIINPAPEILRDCEFWIWPQSEKEWKLIESGKPDKTLHGKIWKKTNGKCCYWHIIGLPEKEHIDMEPLSKKEFTELKQHGLMRYEQEWWNALQISRRLWIKKSPGVGATKFFLGHMAWLALKDDYYNQADMGIVTGPRINIAEDEIKRIPELFREIDYKPKVVGSAINLNGCHVEAYPSHTFDAARGIERVIYWYVDEGDFFPKSQQTKCRTIVERYEAKSHPRIVFTSTAGLPGQLFDTMEHEKISTYERILTLVDKGLRDGIYTKYEVTQAQKDPGYPSEFEGQYGAGIGNIFNTKLLDACIQTYPLESQGGPRLLIIDPAFGDVETSSKFGVVGFERRDEMLHVVHAEEYARPDEAVMIEKVAQIFHQGKFHTLLVDGHYTGLIKAWRNGGRDRERCSTYPVRTQGKVAAMTTNATLKIENDGVRIHPAFTGLIGQLKAVQYMKDGSGKPDKKAFPFDMGDPFTYGCDYWTTKAGGRMLKGKF